MVHGNPTTPAFGSEKSRPHWTTAYCRQTTSMLEIDCGGCWGRWLDAQIRVAAFRLVTDQQKPRHQHQGCTENRKPDGNYVSIIVHFILQLQLSAQDSRIPNSIEDKLGSERSEYDARETSDHIRSSGF